MKNGRQLELIKSDKHKWLNGICQYCGIMRETRIFQGKFYTVYYSPSGHVLRRPKCSGQSAARNILLSILICATLISPAQRISDDAKHVWAGVVISYVSGEVIHAIKPKKGLSICLGFAAGVAAGAAKEIWDATGRGYPSRKDFINTAWGSLCGSLVLTIRLNENDLPKLRKAGKRKQAHRNL